MNVTYTDGLNVTYTVVTSHTFGELASLIDGATLGSMVRVEIPHTGVVQFVVWYHDRFEIVRTVGRVTTHAMFGVRETARDIFLDQVRDLT